MKERDPIEYLTITMAERGWKRRDLLPAFGTTARVSEVLARKRRLSLDHIRVLHFNMGLDASALLRKYSISRR